MSLPVGAGLHSPCLSRRGHLGQPAIRGIDDERRASSSDGLGTAIEPEVIIEAWGAITAAVHLIGRLGPLGWTLKQLLVPVDDFLLEVCRLFFG